MQLMVLDAVRARPELAREEQACQIITASFFMPCLGGSVEQRPGGHHCVIPGLG